MDYDLEPAAIERFRALAGELGPIAPASTTTRHLTVVESPALPS
jgi:hypothetical protein